MRLLRRVGSSVLWGVSGAAAVVVFMMLFDESEHSTINSAGVACGVLRLLFPDEAVAALSRRAWLWILAYFVALEVLLMALLVAYMTGRGGILNTFMATFMWGALAFPSSACAYAIGRTVGGNYGNFEIFAAPPVNTALLALIVGAILRRRAAKAASHLCHG